MAKFKTIEWKEEYVRILDQTKLPFETFYIDLFSIEDVFDSIQKLKVRGAPALGVIAAYGLFLAFQQVKEISADGFFNLLNERINYLNSARPTAVNLNWALQSIKSELRNSQQFNLNDAKDRLLKIAIKIHEDDRRRCENIANFGQEILNNNSRTLTHCNTGALATGGMGTALGAILKAHELGKQIKVFATESRPVLQGARLTVWELENSKIPVTLICDSAAGWLINQHEVDLVLLGADRIAADGSTANKIGTYNLAILANYHKIPFYVAAPFSTVDLSIQTGRSIPIEHRDADEIRKVFGSFPITVADVKCWNPAFDVTPPELIRGIITDEGVIYPPYELNLKSHKQNRKTI
jgi:methylthioribose-1-phosphate isomerase